MTRSVSRQVIPAFYPGLLALTFSLVACSAVGPGSDVGDGDEDGGTGSGATGSGDGDGLGNGDGDGDVVGDGDGSSTGGISGDGDGDSLDCTPVVDRCDCVVQADGVAKVIDSFDDADLRINVIDARDGEWFQAKAIGSGSPLGSMSIDGGGASPSLHLSGSATTTSPPAGQPDNWATFGVPLGQCYNAAAYTGFKFKIKGPAVFATDDNKSIRFSISTPPTTEVSAGGACPDGDLKCYDHFGTNIVLTSNWEEKVVSFASLQQTGWGIAAPAGYDKAAHIMAVNFAPLDNTQSYEFFIDDLEFTTESGSDCTDLIDSATFASLFPSANGFYSYAAFSEAVADFPGFCGEGTTDDRKRDAAALFAHWVQETGAPPTNPATALTHIEEIDKSVYCEGGRADFPCAPGKMYFGRGPLQLTWNYNYGTAGRALGLPLLAQPELVASNAVTAFKTTLWFWMTRQPLDSPHSIMVSTGDFARTIEMVNGPLECGGKQPAKTANRVNAYKHFASLLGVSVGTSLDCN